MTSDREASPAERDIRDALSAAGLTLEEKIGEGGSAAVFSALDRKHDRIVAVKVMANWTGRKADSSRFQREIAVVAVLQHPHILALYDSGVTPAGSRYYVMPLVHGSSLRKRIENGPMAVRETVKIVIEVADALDFAHHVGVIHRDIKPENILIDAGHALVADFGIALGVAPIASRGEPGDQLSASKSRLTAAGFVTGTPAYMSPEQAAGSRQVDGRSDIFSLACVMHEMLTGMPPFIGRNDVEVMARRFAGMRHSVRDLRPDVPEYLSVAISRALAVDAADRFATAAEFGAALESEAVVTLSDERAVPAVDPSRSSDGAIPVTTPSKFRVPPRPKTVGAISILVLLAILLFALKGEPAGGVVLDARRVVVASLSNETGQPDFDPIGSLLTQSLRNGLTTTRLRVVTSSFAIPALHDSRLAGGTLDDPERVGRLATETNAATVVSGSYYLVGGKVEFILEITDARTGELLRSIGPVQTSIAEAQAAADTLRQQVVALVDSLYPGPVDRDTKPKR